MKTLTEMAAQITSVGAHKTNEPYPAPAGAPDTSLPDFLSRQKNPGLNGGHVPAIKAAAEKLAEKKITQPKPESKEAQVRALREASTSAPKAAKAKPAKKPHPADEYNAALLARAVSFTTSIRKGGKNIVDTYETLAAARGAAVGLAAKHNASTKPLVYAVDAQGSSTLVTDDMPDPKAASGSLSPKPEAAKPTTPKPEKGAEQESAMRKTKPTTKSKARSKVAPKAATRAAKPGERNRYDWNGAEEKAAKGTVPAAPDFSAPTHERFRPLLAEVVKAAKAGDVDALKKIKVKPMSSSRKAVDRYRKLCLTALTKKHA